MKFNGTCQVLRFLMFMSYFKHKRPCLTICPNTESRVENTTRSRVFLTNFELVGNVVKHCLKVFVVSSQSKIKLTRKERSKS